MLIEWLDMFRVVWLLDGHTLLPKFLYLHGPSNFENMCRTPYISKSHVSKINYGRNTFI
jgi:hypothetical protein